MECGEYFGNLLLTSQLFIFFTLILNRYLIWKKKVSLAAQFLLVMISIALIFFIYFNWPGHSLKIAEDRWHKFSIHLDADGNIPIISKGPNVSNVVLAREAVARLAEFDAATIRNSNEGWDNNNEPLFFSAGIGSAITATAAALISLRRRREIAE